MGWLAGVHFSSADDVYEFMQDVQQRKLLESPQIYFYGMYPTLMVIEKQGISQLKSSTFDQNFCYFPLDVSIADFLRGLQNEARSK